MMLLHIKVSFLIVEIGLRRSRAYQGGEGGFSPEALPSAGRAPPKVKREGFLFW